MAHEKEIERNSGKEQMVTKKSGKPQNNGSHKTSRNKTKQKKDNGQN